MKKNALRTSSLIAALLGWLLLSVLNVFINWALWDRARLVRDNDNERTLNTIWTELRNYDDFGSVVESNPILKERIIGVAVYGHNLQPVSRWGKVPSVFDENILRTRERSRFGRYTIPDRQGRSSKFVLRFGRMPPPAMGQGMMRPREPQEHDNNGERSLEQRHEPGWQNQIGQEPVQQDAFLFNFNNFSGNRYFYIDIFHPDYWRTRTLTTILFPLTEIALLILVFYIRRLYLRNREYREKIEAQHNLVVLGTAAGTLAHEIKNPLLSIRLQTGILEKICAENEKEEIGIINQEVDRLSSLVYRVNDYLREPEGEKSVLNISELLAETSRRICGAEIIAAGSEPPAFVVVDENRIRSVLENIFRNAAESGSPLTEIGVSVHVGGKAHNAAGGRVHGSAGAYSGNVVIRIFDRGRGIPEKNLKRVFDPFFTSKSTGTGIGLAISKRFTEAAGGTISVENREGGGLMVTLVFPQYREKE
ncbi:MAG: HAMP domain-containing histidine kinase [Treponema sp.]|nr:HAMP domain-containing histidine kinase [Treponema sp.]